MRYAWTTVTPTAPITYPNRNSHCAVVINGAVLVAGGVGGTYFNDVWRTSDGMTWTRVTSSASFPARGYHGCSIVGTQIVLVGGRTVTGFMNDVWVSNNTGLNWTNTTSGSFAARRWFGFAAFLGKLWVIGGTGSDNYNDVWCTNSTTLGNWTLANGSVFSYPRYGMGITLFNSRLWVSAGYSPGFGYPTDVWRIAYCDVLREGRGGGAELTTFTWRACLLTAAPSFMPPSGGS